MFDPALVNCPGTHGSKDIPNLMNQPDARIVYRQRQS